MIVLIDNYDSFTFNLYQILESCVPCRIIRNDEMSAEEVIHLKPNAIVISPGPGTPDMAGITLDLIKKAAPTIPILGICLGMQSIVKAFGGTVSETHNSKHGLQSTLTNTTSDLFVGCEQPIVVARYHSLCAKADEIPTCLSVDGLSLEDGVVMSIRHRHYETYGLQFHPESFMTPSGATMIRNFLMKQRRECHA